MKPTSKRQADHHNKMIEAGFRKRSFYVSDDTLKALEEYKRANDLKNLHEALNQLIRRIGDQ